jgi:hypothetical protein
MRSLRDLALELAAITVIADSAKEAKEKLRAEFADALEAVGADAAKANLDGDDIAKVSLIKPKKSAVINDDQKFLKWVKDNAPTEVVESVRDSYRKVLLEAIEISNDEAFHPQTGEVLEFITIVEKSPYISTRFQPEGRAKVIDAIAFNRLPMGMTLKELGQ